MSLNSSKRECSSRVKPQKMCKNLKESQQKSTTLMETLKNLEKKMF